MISVVSSFLHGNGHLADSLKEIFHISAEFSLHRVAHFLPSSRLHLALLVLSLFNVPSSSKLKR